MRTAAYLVALVIAVMTLAGCGGVSVKEGEDLMHEVWAAEAELVARYCIYGSISEAQYDGCVQHVTARYVERSHSNAAEWAKGNRKTCGYDAGPQCGRAARERIQEGVERVP